MSDDAGTATEPASEAADLAVYQAVARQLRNRHTPSVYVYCDTSTWPPALTDRQLGLYDRDCEEVVAALKPAPTHADEDTAVLVAPPDYVPPTTQEPFASITDPETLPPAGQLVYEVLTDIEWIGISPHPELTALRDLARGPLRELHVTHNYQPTQMGEALIRTAQDRGDLPAGKAGDGV